MPRLTVPQRHALLYRLVERGSEKGCSNVIWGLEHDKNVYLGRRGFQMHVKDDIKLKTQHAS